MDKLKFSLFDIFAYTLPGIIVFIALAMTMSEIYPTIPLTVKHLRELVKEIDGTNIAVILSLSYILGFVTHFFGFMYFHLFAKRLWKKKLKGVEMSLSNLQREYVLVRHFSKGNLAYVDTWNYLRAMCINLSLSFLGFAFIIIYKLIASGYCNFEWIVTSLALLLIAAVMLREAIKFHIWSFNALHDTVNVLRLNERVASDGGIKEDE